MAILIYTCSECGLVTRVEEGQDFRACNCRVPYQIVREDDGTVIQAMPEKPNGG